MPSSSVSKSKKSDTMHEWRSQIAWKEKECEEFDDDEESMDQS